MRIPLLMVISRVPLDAARLTASERHRLHGLTAQRAADFLAARRAEHLVRAVVSSSLEPDRDPPSCAWRSVAHTGGIGVCAAALEPPPVALAGVGVDVERPRVASARAARFYLREPEIDWLSGAARDDSARAAEQVRLWTTKEALFKADPGNRATVLQSYLLRDPGGAVGTARRIPAGADGNAHPFGYIHARFADLHLAIAVALRAPSAVTAADRWQRRNVSGPTITFDAVAERISAVLSIPRDRLTPDSTLADLAADSFLLVEMVVDLQEEFDSVFTQAELRQVTKLGDLVALLQQHSGGGTNAAMDGQFGR